MNQRKIAAALGISQATVSLALNNSQNPKISQAKRDMVLNYMRKHNYYPLHSRGKTKSICYIFPDHSDNLLQYHDFYNRFLAGIEKAASDSDYTLCIQNYRKDEALVFPQKKVDGIIYEGNIDLARLKEIMNCCPAVLLNNLLCEPVCDVVFADSFGGILLAMNHLKDQGHRKVAYFNIDVKDKIHTTMTNTQRFGAFISLSKALKMEQNDNYLQSHSISEACIAANEAKINETLRLWRKMPNPPTATLCFNDFQALLMIRQASLLGIRIPEDLSIIGFDNIPSSMLSVPSLTTVDQNAREIGYLSVETLIRRIEKPNRPMLKISSNPKLVIRDSVMNIKNPEKNREREKVKI